MFKRGKLSSKGTAILTSLAMLMSVTTGIVSNTQEVEAADYGISNPRIAADGTDAFIMADKALDGKSYNEEDKSVTWETCTLRKWLNNCMVELFNHLFVGSELCGYCIIVCKTDYLGDSELEFFSKFSEKLLSCKRIGAVSVGNKLKVFG